MNWLLDIILVVFFALVVFITAKRGFVKSIWSLITSVAALAAALFFGELLGSFIYDVFALDFFTGTIETALSAIIQPEAGLYNIANLFEETSEEFVNILASCGITAEEIASQYADITAATQEAFTEFARSIAAPVARTISNAIGYVAIFFVTLILMFIVGKIVNLAVKLPVLKQANGVLGALLGVIMGLIYIWIISIVISVFVETGLIGESTATLKAIAENSYIFRFFCHLSPLDYINIKSF